MLNCDEIIWNPSDFYLNQTYAAQLMKKLGVNSHDALWKHSIVDIAVFWDFIMKDIGVEWFTPYAKVLDQSKGIAWANWFIGGKINLAHNCVDRHQTPLKQKTIAMIWEGDSGEIRRITYETFGKEVNQAANALKQLGVTKGDSVGILMPMVPEVVVQLFACFKIGAIAIPVFSGFGSDAVAFRFREAGVKVIFTCDASFRRGKRIDVKTVADQAAANIPSLCAKIIYRRGDGKCAWNPKTDVWWHEFVLEQPSQCPTLALDSEAHSMIVFTSGTTGNPKGTVHTHAGVLAQVGKEHRYTFNVDDKTCFFWFTDIGWMMGPWEMIGVTFFGGTLVLFEGAPDYPTPERLWETLERHQVNVFGISPTAIRMLMVFGAERLEQFALNSLKFLGSTGELWDPESYQWFFKNVGKSRCPIMNISGGTEIMGCLLSPLPIRPLKPCSLGGPSLGVDADVFDESGHSVRGGIGHLVCKQPLPSMTKGFLKEKQRYLDTYFSKWEGVWYHGDWAHVDGDGFWFLHGRSDDTIKIGGKRVGPAEYESALMQHPKISEVAAVGVPDSLKGENCVCFAVLKPNTSLDPKLREELHALAVNAMGKALAPKEIRFVRMLPKTRSAKILRGLIKKIYLRQELGDTASVENKDAIQAIESSE